MIAAVAPITDTRILPSDHLPTVKCHDCISNLLTVHLQMDPVAARHPELTLCLWKGRTAEEVLDCVPVKQP